MSGGAMTVWRRRLSPASESRTPLKRWAELEPERGLEREQGPESKKKPTWERGQGSEGKPERGPES